MRICGLGVGRHDELPNHDAAFLDLLPGDPCVQKIKMIIMLATNFGNLTERTVGNCPFQLSIEVIENSKMEITVSDVSKVTPIPSSL